MSTSATTVPDVGVRPEWIPCPGGRESLRAHDRFYLAELRRWAYVLADADPAWFPSPEAVQRRRWHYDRCACGRVKGRRSDRCLRCEMRRRRATLKRAQQAFDAWHEVARQWYTDRQLTPPTWGDA